MSYTAQDLLSSSLRLIGVLASGESLPANEATDGLSSLNDMLDSWSTNSLLIPNKVREVFPLVPSQQTYTMGTGGNFNTSRPQKIENALIQLVATSPMLELQVKILTKDEYAAIGIKTLTSTFPLFLYADDAYPLTSISFFPVPTEADNLVLYSWKALSQLASLTTALSLPPGYARAIRYNLAVELAPEYGKQIPEAVAAKAGASLADIKRMNSKPKYARIDEALQSSTGAFNWFTGEPM